MVNIGSLNIGHSFRPTHNIQPIKIQQVATVSPIRIQTVQAVSISNSSSSTNVVPQIKYLTKWKIVGNSGLYPVGDLKGWSIEGNSEVRNNQIYSCGDLEADGKYHIKVKSGSQVIDIPLDEPLRKVGSIADTIEFPSANIGNVDFSSYGESGYIGTNNQWTKNYEGFMIPVIPDCTYKLEADNTIVAYALLKDKEHINDNIIDQRQTLTANGIVEFDIPSNCKYLWTSKDVGGSNVSPKSLTLVRVSSNTAKVTRKISSVDLGSLSWTRISAGVGSRYNCKLETAKPTISTTLAANIIHAIYTNDKATNTAKGLTNNTVSVNMSSVVYVVLTEGVPEGELIYELAEPTTSYISVPSIPSNKNNVYLPKNQLNYSKFTYNAENGVWSCGDYNSETGKYDIKIKCGEETVIISLDEPLRKVKDTYDRIEYTEGNTAKLVRKLANANNNFSQATILNDEIKIPLTPNGTGQIDGFGTVANVLFHTKVNRMSGFGQYVYLDKGNYTDIEQWKKDNINQNLIYATMDYTVSEIPVQKIPESNSYIQEITESSLPWTSFTYNENMVEEDDDDWSDDFD